MFEILSLYVTRQDYDMVHRMINSAWTGHQCSKLVAVDDYINRKSMTNGVIISRRIGT